MVPALPARSWRLLDLCHPARAVPDFRVWLPNNDVDFDDRWFPKTAGIVVDFVPLGPDRFGLRFNVDCRRPNRWREEPYLSKIRAMALSGLRGHRGKKWLTFVVVAPKPWLLVLSHGEVEYRLGARIVQVTPDRFEQRAAALTGVASL
jgi:hypothetical protein